MTNKVTIEFDKASFKKDDIENEIDKIIEEEKKIRDLSQIALFPFSLSEEDKKSIQEISKGKATLVADPVTTWGNSVE